jgi:FixJ family two-component response regulator
MSSVIPIVFMVDDDVSVRESLELLVRNENWKPETFAHTPRPMRFEYAQEKRLTPPFGAVASEMTDVG